MSEKVVEVDGKRFLKVKKGEYYNKKTKRKMRHRHTLRWILVIFLTVFIVAPVGFVFGAFYEPGTKSNLPTAENYLNTFSTKLAEGLLEIPSGNLTVGLDENSIDTLLGYSRTMLNNTPADNFIDNFYCYINGYDYEFVAEAHAAFFKTKVHIYTTLDSEGEDLRFKINDIKVGRLGLGNLASTILPKFLSEDNLNKMFNDAGFSAKLSLANKEITYKKEKLRTEIGGKLEVLLGEVGSTLGSIIINLWDELSESGISFNNGISLKLNLTKLMTCKDREILKNTNACTTQSRMSKYIHFAEDCLKDKCLESENASKLISYFISGYKKEYEDTLFSNTSMQEKTTSFIKNDLSINNETYNTYKGDKDNKKQGKGYRSNYIDDLVGVINGKYEGSYTESRFRTDYDITDFQSFFCTDGLLEDLLTIGDDLLSDYFRSPSMSMVGPLMATPLTFGNNVCLPAMSIADFSVKFYNDEVSSKPKLIMDSDIDLYGALMPLRITTTVDSTIEEGGGRYITFTVDTVKLGNISLEDNVKAILLKYLGDILPKGGILSFGSNSFRIDTTIFEFEGEGGTAVKTLIANILKGRPDDDLNFKFNDDFSAKYNPAKIQLILTLDANNVLHLSLYNARKY